MKRLWVVLVVLFLLAGLVPAALAQGSVDQTAAPPAGAVEAPAANAPVASPAGAKPEAVLYFWDFEGNNGGFASTLDWQWGTYAWVGNGCYGTSHVEPPAAYSGTDMWGTVLNTCYSDLGNNANPCANVNPNDDSILSLAIDLSGVVGDAELSWWEWYDLFGSWDWAEVRANGTVVWQNCESHVAPTAWVQQTVDLTPYAGGPVTIEFHMMASTVVNYAGWYIDDVMVTGLLQPPIVWDKTIDGIPWTPDISITRETSDTIVVEEVLHLTPPPPRGPTAAPVGDWQPNLPVAPVPPGRTPETVGGTPPPAPALPAGTPRPQQADGLLYLTSLDIPNTTFAVYDPATDAWTTLAPFETGCQMAVSGAGQLYAYNHTGGTIDLYDPATDTWTAVLPAPPGASGQQCNLEITAAGEFLYTQFDSTTLWYTAGGVWNTLALPFVGNAMGDYDPTADQYVVGQAWTTNAHMIDVHTWAITDFTSPVGNGENARSGVVLGNRYYFEAAGSNMHSFDLGNPALPPLDHGVSPGWYTSAAGDRLNAVVYNASLDGTALNFFDPATNLITPLTGYGTAIWHSSLAFVPIQQGPVYAQIETWDPAHLHLLDWAATGGNVIVAPARLEWTGMIVEPMAITLTKWFHVEPCTWTTTLLWEELWLDGVEVEQRPVLVHKLPPELWIDSAYDPAVCPGAPADFTLLYGNLGGYENNVWVRNEFPPEALFASSDPPPDNVDPAGTWAEWLVGDLPMDAEGRITVTVSITDTALPGQLISIYDWILDHIGEPRDMTEIVYTVGGPDIGVEPAALWAELCPDTTTTRDLLICNVGDCPLVWRLREMSPTLSVLSGLEVVDTVSNGPQGTAEAAPTSSILAGPLALGDLLFEIMAEAATGNNLLLGVEFAQGHYWVTGGDAAGGIGSLYQLDTAGNLVGTYSQAGGCTGWGARDLAFDGTYLYYGCDDGLIHEVDPATGAPTGVTIPSPVTPPRALAYDSVSDHFWTANWDSILYEIDRAGTVINGFPAVGLSTYGMAWDAWTPGGPFLWLYSQDGPDPLLLASQVEPTTGALTGVSFLGSGVAGEMAGGAAGSDQIVPGLAVFLGMNQGIADRIGVYELAIAGPPVDIPWLSEDPITGTVGAGECQTVTVTFDATGLAPGDYLANLFIDSNDPDEPVVTVPVTMTVLEPVLVSVTYVVADAQVTFDATATGSEPISYLWDFGDGITSTLEDPVHDYTASGCYTVTLDVYNACGQDTWSEEICVVVPCVGPSAVAFTWSPTSPFVSETTRFTGTVGGGTGPFFYTWDFGDGSGATGSANVSYIYAEAGTFTVTLTVTNTCGMDDMSYSIVVQPVEPTFWYVYLPIVYKGD